MVKINLDELLTQKEMTAYGLAKQTGLHQSVISKLKSNKAIALRLDVLGKLCDALECEPGDLLVRVEEAKATKKGGKK